MAERSVRDAARLASVHRRQVFAVRSRALAFVQAHWTGLGSWRDGDIERFVAAVTPMVAAGQRQIGQLTDSYLAAVLSQLQGQLVKPVVIPPELLTTEALRGVAAAEVYSRPFHATWAALSAGKAFPDALAAGARRLTSITATDMQLAKTNAARMALSGRGNVAGYRRVLEGPYSCGLCVVASTQRYHTNKLLAIHSSCDCGIMPIVGDRDPGQVINEPLLKGAHGAIERRFGRRDYSARAEDYRSKLKINEHPEIGPVLEVA